MQEANEVAFSLNPEYWWLIAGAIFCVIEVFVVTGVGSLFIGLAALCVGGLVGFGVIHSESVIAQFAVCFALIPAWAGLLWQPLKKYRSGSTPYNNMVGDIALVAKHALHKGKPGQATWSGTIMTAELSEASATAELAVGTQVKIVDVKGTTLIVEPVAQ